MTMRWDLAAGSADPTQPVPRDATEDGCQPSL